MSLFSWSYKAHFACLCGMNETLFALVVPFFGSFLFRSCSCSCLQIGIFQARFVLMLCLLFLEREGKRNKGYKRGYERLSDDIGTCYGRKREE